MRKRKKKTKEPTHERKKREKLKSHAAKVQSYKQTVITISQKGL